MARHSLQEEARGAFEELSKGEADAEALLTDAHCLEDASRAHLRHHLLAAEHARLLGAVGLHTADPMGMGAVNFCHQPHELVLKEAADSAGGFEARARGLRLRQRLLLGGLVVRDEAGDKRIGAPEEDLLQRVFCRVGVLAAEAVDSVRNVASVVSNDEGVVQSLRFVKVRVGSLRTARTKRIVDFGAEGEVAAVAEGALVVEQRSDA